MDSTTEYAVGWYRMPDQPRLHRFWNGERWIEPAAAEADGPVTVPAPRQPPPATRGGQD